MCAVRFAPDIHFTLFKPDVFGKVYVSVMKVLVSRGMHTTWTLHVIYWLWWCRCVFLESGVCVTQHPYDLYLISDDRECDYWHLLHCKYFKKDRCEMGKDCLFVHPQTKTRLTSPLRKGRGKANIIRQRRSIGCKTEYCKSQCPLDSHRKPWACTRDTLMHHPMIIGLPSGIQEKKCIVDSGASLHMMGSSSLKLKEKKTIRQSSKIFLGYSIRQWHCGLRHASDCLICRYTLWKIHRQC